MAAATALLVLFFRHQQFGGNHKQREAPDQLEVGQLHQRRNDARKDDAEDDRGRRAKDHAPETLLRRQPTTGKRNHQRVVAGQQNIDPDDLADGEPESRMLHLASKFGEDRRDGDRRS